MYPFYRAWSIAILSVSVIIFCSSLFLFLEDKTGGKIALKISPNSGEFRLGEPINLGVYFEGSHASKVVAAQIKLNFAQDEFKIISADAGPYFTQAYLIESDLEQGKFTVSENPNLKQADKIADASALRLQVVPLKAGRLALEFDKTSDLYISKPVDKGVTPRLTTSYFEIVNK